MLTSSQKLQSFASRFLYHLLPKANTGSLWLDLAYLLLIIALQVSILPSLLRGAYVDLLTPWLTLIFIGQRTSRGMILGLIAAISLENHATTPAGLYFCSYWIMGTLIIMVKNHISWRNLLPWLTTFAVSQLWIIIFESFVYFIKTGGLHFFNLEYALSCGIHLLFATGFGISISRRGQISITEEKNP